MLRCQLLLLAQPGKIRHTERTIPELGWGFAGGEGHADCGPENKSEGADEDGVQDHLAEEGDNNRAHGDGEGFGGTLVSAAQHVHTERQEAYNVEQRSGDAEGVEALEQGAVMGADAGVCTPGFVVGVEAAHAFAHWLVKNVLKGEEMAADALVVADVFGGVGKGLEPSGDDVVDYGELRGDHHQDDAGEKSCDDAKASFAGELQGEITDAEDEADPGGATACEQECEEGCRGRKSLELSFECEEHDEAGHHVGGARGGRVEGAEDANVEGFGDAEWVGVEVDHPLTVPRWQGKKLIDAVGTDGE